MTNKKHNPLFLALYTHNYLSSFTFQLAHAKVLGSFTGLAVDGDRQVISQEATRMTALQEGSHDAMMGPPIWVSDEDVNVPTSGLASAIGPAGHHLQASVDTTGHLFHLVNNSGWGLIGFKGQHYSLLISLFSPWTQSLPLLPSAFSL